MTATLIDADHNCTHMGCKRSHPHNRTQWRNIEATEAVVEIIESLPLGTTWTHRELWERHGARVWVWYATLVNIVRELRMAGLVHVVGKSGEKPHGNALLFTRAAMPAELRRPDTHGW